MSMNGSRQKEAYSHSIKRGLSWNGIFVNFVGALERGHLKIHKSPSQSHATFDL